MTDSSDFGFRACRDEGVSSRATILKYDVSRMDLRFDALIAPGSYQLVLRRMNEGGKSYALACLKVEAVAA